jgi:hypothetical protein
MADTLANDAKAKNQNSVINLKWCHGWRALIGLRNAAGSVVSLGAFADPVALKLSGTPKN